MEFFDKIWDFATHVDTIYGVFALAIIVFFTIFLILFKNDKKFLSKIFGRIFSKKTINENIEKIGENLQSNLAELKESHLKIVKNHEILTKQVNTNKHNIENILSINELNKAQNNDINNKLDIILDNNKKEHYKANLSNKIRKLFSEFIQLHLLKNTDFSKFLQTLQKICINFFKEIRNIGLTDINKDDALRIIESEFELIFTNEIYENLKIDEEKCLCFLFRETNNFLNNLQTIQFSKKNGKLQKAFDNISLHFVNSLIEEITILYKNKT